MSPILTQEQVSDLAGNHFPRIADVIQQAFQDYLDSLKGINALGIKTNLKARTSASLIHDYIQIRAREKFANESNIKVDEFNGIFGLLISKRLFVRFKKLTPEMKTSNVSTEQVDLFNKQQLEIPGTDQVTMLTAGYCRMLRGPLSRMYFSCVKLTMNLCGIKISTVKQARYRSSQRPHRLKTCRLTNQWFG